MWNKIKRKHLKYNFQQFQTIRSFGDNIYTGKINLDEAEMDQSNLVENMAEFNNKIRPKKKKRRERNKILLTLSSLRSTLYEGQELTVNAFRSGIFQIKPTKGKSCLSDLPMWLKKSSPTQMLQRLPIALA